jgi:hypothetical protein
MRYGELLCYKLIRWRHDDCASHFVTPRYIKGKGWGCPTSLLDARSEGKIHD